MTLAHSSYLNTPIDFPSPAKINLFLHIVGRRDNGYHELETLFQFLDYGDTLSITATESEQIDLLTPIIGVKNEDNLIIKAAKLLKATSKSQYGAQISLNKILPMGGGLGGGSSNAATILIALNLLWQCGLSTKELATLGLSLGADVPIFIHGFAAFAQGIGEQLSPALPQECWYLITKPACSISTQSVFTHEKLTRDTQKLPVNNQQLNDFSHDLFCPPYHNDCQDVVINSYSEVAKLLAWLIEYAPSRMTGTGACIFSRFSSYNEACALQAKLPENVASFVARGVNKSPLCFTIEKLKTNN
ncbi:4-(cytidine 5'-diphospho)-2-C-methyl-D-erythritol kinase [Colwellia asteriadis]|uniref:4-diphosphocytidyl-2-C-methyl-D-erythritol kinase n=1 Tax=Colwellia asteriadis TaxID=517723 RepID=A0ABN1L6D2_9GAMM